jgi:hypothetical protein
MFYGKNTTPENFETWGFGRTITFRYRPYVAPRTPWKTKRFQR